LLGKVYLAQKQQEKAKQIFDWILISDPENVVAYYSLGYIYENMKDNSTALACFRQAYECSKGDRTLRENMKRLQVLPGSKRFMLSRSGLARLYIRGGLYSLAIWEWEAVLEANPGRLDARIGLLEAYWYSSSYNQAEKLALLILGDAPDCLKALLVLAHISSFAKNEQKTKKLIEQVLFLDPNLTITKDLLNKIIKDQSPFSSLLKKEPSLLPANINHNVLSDIENRIEENLSRCGQSIAILSSVKKAEVVQIEHRGLLTAANVFALINKNILMY